MVLLLVPPNFVFLINHELAVGTMIQPCATRTQNSELRQLFIQPLNNK